MTHSRHGGGLLLPFLDTKPQIADDVYLAPGSKIIGDVRIGAGSSVWFNCVLRGDVNSIHVGAGSNIQDGTVVHVSRKTHPTFIGDNVLIGHMAMIHGCTLHDRSFVGLGAIIMDGCVIEDDAMLAAGSLLAPGKRMQRGELWMGRPAQKVRLLSDADIEAQRKGAEGYAELAQIYLKSARDPQI
ncbi:MULTISPECIES: gamma carbonic anhydrase family protein [unclassified Iodidimonas]|jgi:carbonic anhydrase/acetyltransferase-like protein (isoleucine patch superfamily)|uniref:gamma carbonic anhydrase family protein n=1 Tax=unclassified Iodidimonas TaxID=2626145 RepID=UPI0024823AA3|nr:MULTISPECIES: gamma carbonic anhydrase family protein [unclassified Iodidimonas]